MRTLSTVESIESLLDGVSLSDDPTAASLIRARSIIASFLASAIAHHLQNEALVRVSEDLVSLSRRVAFVNEGQEDDRFRFLHAYYSFVSRLDDFFSSLASARSSGSLVPRDEGKFDRSLEACRDILSRIRRTLSVSYQFASTPYGDIDLSRIASSYRRLLKSLRSLRDALFSYEDFLVPGAPSVRTGSASQEEEVVREPLAGGAPSIFG